MKAFHYNAKKQTLSTCIDKFKEAVEGIEKWKQSGSLASQETHVHELFAGMNAAAANFEEVVTAMEKLKKRMDTLTATASRRTNTKRNRISEALRTKGLPTHAASMVASNIDTIEEEAEACASMCFLLVGLF